MQTVIANRNDFFYPNSCPVALRSIQGDATMQHEGDLTDIRHTHDFAELIIISRGSAKHWIDGNIYNVSAGDIFLLQGNTEHYFTERCDLGMYNLMFDDVYFQDHLRSLRSLPGFNGFFLIEPAYRHRHKFRHRLHLEGEDLVALTSKFRQLETELKLQRPGFDLILFARALEIFVLISRKYFENPNAKSSSLCALAELVTVLENSYDEDWSIARLCKISSMSPSSLIPAFKEITGSSPIEYLLHVRMSKAAEKLLAGKDTVSEVANSCGFADSNYFSRQFRKHYHCSPLQYRARKLN